jgi:hypothetical protein
LQLGLPIGELEASGAGLRVDTLAGRGHDATNPAPGGDESLELERWLTIDRVVNGLPVVESQVRGVVSNSGEIARLSARWPRFQLRPGLSLRSRQSVLDEIADHLWDAEFGAAIAVRAELAYDRVGDLFLPVAVISFDDPQSGEELIVPLAELPPDLDADGVADAVDNCVDVENPGQGDRDKDSVGDSCDNCPEVANPLQEDGGTGSGSEPDGIGDACASPVDGCRLPDATCDALSVEICGLAGGVSLALELVEGLRFDSSVSMSWTTVPSMPGPFALYRGTFGLGPWTYDHTCQGAEILLPAATDATVPRPGDGFYYLVTARDLCGESSPGHDGTGNERPLPDACP